MRRVSWNSQNNGVINKSVNATFIPLVTKRNKISTVVDFSLNKVIAKVLSPHIHKVLHEIIHWSQDFS